MQGHIHEVKFYTWNNIATKAVVLQKIINIKINTGAPNIKSLRVYRKQPNATAVY